MRDIKSASSRWMKETCAMRDFEWQEGYGAFSIGFAQKSATTAYIRGQQDHHRNRDFQAEFLAISEKDRMDTTRSTCGGEIIVPYLITPRSLRSIKAITHGNILAFKLPQSSPAPALCSALTPAADERPSATS